MKRPQIIVGEGEWRNGQGLTRMRRRRIKWVSARDAAFGAVSASWSSFGAFDPLGLAALAATAALVVETEFTRPGGVDHMSLHLRG